MLFQTSFAALLIFVVEATAWSSVDGDLRLEFGNILLPRQITNLQTFKGSLGGAAAEPITKNGDPNRPFQVGSSTFPDFKTAADRTCDDQKNACSQVANDENRSSDFTVKDCDNQRLECLDFQSKATVTSFDSSPSSQAQVISSDDKFTFFCDP